MTFHSSLGWVSTIEGRSEIGLQARDRERHAGVGPVRARTTCLEVDVGGVAEAARGTVALGDARVDGRGREGVVQQGEREGLLVVARADAQVCGHLADDAVLVVFHHLHGAAEAVGVGRVGDPLAARLDRVVVPDGLSLGLDVVVPEPGDTEGIFHVALGLLDVEELLVGRGERRVVVEEDLRNPGLQDLRK
jgi:hypothetical protein